MRTPASLAALVAGAIAACIATAAAPAAEQAVLDGAKQEGKLLVYTGIERDVGQAIIDAFRKKYPFIAAESVRASSSKLATRLDAEIAADRVQGDVVEFSTLYLTTGLKQRGELLEYKSPEYAQFPATYADAGWWAATGVSNII